jgi:hypothetical protein
MSKITTEFDPQPEDFDDQLFQESHDEGALEDPLPVAGYKSVCYCWRLICPPDNWRDPIPLDVAELRLLEILTQRLDLVLTRDDKRKKLYLGLADGRLLGSADGVDGSDGAACHKGSYEIRTQAPLFVKPGTFDKFSKGNRILPTG